MDENLTAVYIIVFIGCAESRELPWRPRPIIHLCRNGRQSINQSTTNSTGRSSFSPSHAAAATVQAAARTVLDTILSADRAAAYWLDRPMMRFTGPGKLVIRRAQAEPKTFLTQQCRRHQALFQHPPDRVLL